MCRCLTAHVYAWTAAGCVFVLVRVFDCSSRVYFPPDMTFLARRCICMSSHVCIFTEVAGRAIRLLAQGLRYPKHVPVREAPAELLCTISISVSTQCLLLLVIDKVSSPQTDWIPPSCSIALLFSHHLPSIAKPPANPAVRGCCLTLFRPVK